MAGESERPASGYAAERPKAFVDAVVAIALTLLILPLMDSVGDVAGSGRDTLAWALDHGSQIVSFLLSFALIAMFWMIHHRLFAAVERVTQVLLWLLAAWMLTIVWLPVATAIAGRMPDEDALARVLYIGSLILTSLVSLAIRLYLRAHPETGPADGDEALRGVAVDGSLVLLFGVALAAALLVPGLGYVALLVMCLTGPVQRLLERLLGVAGRAPRPGRAGERPRPGSPGRPGRARRRSGGDP